MISIIICSVNQTLLDQLKLNIEDTIGLTHEIIAIDNSETKNGICKVYNTGGDRAIFPVLCFIHEDILFETRNWGLLILEHFNDHKTGLIGLAGGDTKGIVPSSWSTSFKSNEVNIIQHNKTIDDEGQHVFITENGIRQTRKKVATLDGVFLCTTKNIFDQFKFDEESFKGFHGYDIDYSLQVLSRYDVIAIFDVLIRHFSAGKADKKWLESAFIINKKWKNNLPVSVHSLSAEEFNLYHWKSLQIFLERLFRLNCSYHQIIFYYFYYSFSRYFTLRRFFSMGKYVLLSMCEKHFEANPSKWKILKPAK